MRITPLPRPNDHPPGKFYRNLSTFWIISSVENTNAHKQAVREAATICPRPLQVDLWPLTFWSWKWCLSTSASEMAFKFIQLHYVGWNNSSHPSWMLYFACRRKGVHLCFIMSPGKMIFAVLELWLSSLQWVLNW